MFFCDLRFANNRCIRLLAPLWSNSGRVETRLLITSQGCVEFWNVATRPQTSNGFGFNTVDTNRLLRFIERVFTLIPDGPDVYPAWRNLVMTFGVSGAKVYDARLVATMQVHRITRILTFNTQDFTRYANIGIVAVDPATI